VTSRVLGICVDCLDAALVARFWAKTLGGEVVRDTSGGWLLKAGTHAPWLTFQPTAEGKFFRNRLRLGLITHDFEFEVARLLSLGALRLEDGAEGDRRRTTFADVEGNEFDLIDGRDREKEFW
jgi:hypothetical protein